MIAGGFPTVALEIGASSFAPALHIRELDAKYPIRILFSVRYLPKKLDQRSKKCSMNAVLAVVKFL